MLIAVTTDETSGMRRLVLGLEEENIKRLLDDQPILKNLGETGVKQLEGWEITILGPEDTVRFVTHYGVKVGR